MAGRFKRLMATTPTAIRQAYTLMFSDIRAISARCLITRTLELSYHAIPLPKLDVVVINKLLCRFDCCAVVSTIKNYRFHEMTVAANYVCSEVGQMAHAG